MNNDEITEWAKLFVSQQIIADERVPFDRLIAGHFSTFEKLRAQGLTWRSIGTLLSKAGLRRKDGTELSCDQLRADFSRLSNRRSNKANLSKTKQVLKPEKSPTINALGHELAKTTYNKSDSEKAAPKLNGPIPDKTISVNEMNAVILRLRKT